MNDHAPPADAGSPLHTIRVAKRERFVWIDARTVNDRRLSWKARGLLAYLLDKPETWRVSADAIANAAPDGRAAVLSGLRELREAGYIVMVRQQNDKGLWTTSQTVYEHPSLAEKPLVAPEVENRTSVAQPKAGYPTSDNRPVRNQDSVDKTSPTPRSGSKAPEPEQGGREDRIIRAAIDLRVRQATDAGGIKSVEAFRRSVAAELAASEARAKIARWAADYPTAPDDVLAACLLGSTGALRYYPRADGDAALYAAYDPPGEAGNPSQFPKPSLTLIHNAGGVNG